MAGRKLRRDGYSILARNWRWHRYELDLIARKGDLVAVVEVKTRRDDRFGAPQEAVPVWKQRRIARAAQAYVRKENLDDCLIRFDIIAVTVDGEGGIEVNHIENAFTC